MEYLLKRARIVLSDPGPSPAENIREIRSFSEGGGFKGSTSIVPK